MDRRFSSREFAGSARRRSKFGSAERRSTARLDKSRDRESRVAGSNEFLASRDCAIVLNRDSRKRSRDRSSSDTRVLDLESLSVVLSSRFLDSRSLISRESLLDKRSRLRDRESTNFGDVDGALDSDTFNSGLLIGVVTNFGSAIGLLTKGLKFGQASTSWGARCVSSGPARLPACPSLSLDTNPSVRHASDTIRSPMYCQDRTGSTTWRVRRILLRN